MIKPASKVEYFSKIAELFSIAGQPKNSPNIKLCLMNIAHRAIDIK
jgi:hypothetical protein